MANKDLLLFQVERGVNDYRRICNVLGRRNNYDVVIAHETYCSGLAALYYSSHQKGNALKILDIVEYPVFSQRSSAKVRDAGLKNRYADLLTFDFAVNISNKYDYCISTSVGQASLYVSHGCKTKIDLVMNCRLEAESNVIHKNILSDMYQFTKDDIVLVYPNRAYQHCGLETSIEAMALLGERFRLVVLGEVVQEISDKVESLVKALNLENRFFITGMLDPSMILPILSEADTALVLLESVVDNHKCSLPNRLFDAIAAKVSVVAFTGTELADFVDKNSLGVVCGANDPHALADVIKTSIEKQAYFKPFVSRANENFNWSSQSSRFLNYICENGSDVRRVLVVAIKDIRRNDRVKRILRSLVDASYEVDVVTKFEPLDSMIVDGANYYCLDK